MNGISAIFLIFTPLLAHSASADPAPSSASTSAADGSKLLPTTPIAAGVDDMLTNNNLRALSGSTSLWSIASQFNYNGGTISSPLSQDRPDISDASGTTTKADLDGSISAKYNLNTSNALLAGVGVRWIAPFATGNLKNYDGSAFDIMNPYVEYQYIYKWLGVQSVLQVEVMQWTQADYTALGYGQQLNFDQENMYQIGDSKLSVGASVELQYQWFNKSGAYGNPANANYVSDVATAQSQYLFTVAPELEYQLSEKIDIRTLINVWTYEHYKSAANLSFTHDTIYQSIGVGVSIARNFYLYPNVQFLPGQIEAQLTNVGVQATINLF